MAIPLAVGKVVGNAAGQVAIQLALEKAFFNKDVKNTTKATENAFAKSFDNVEKQSKKSFGGIGSAIKTAFTIVATGAVAQFAKNAVNAASETQAAWTGLNSIVTGTGKSFEEAQGFLNEYISDGLIPLTDAITSYKNLAARGYSTEQIEKTMLALKDAAAFGRQASYSYGEAIKSATEGLKNENSILVDNAGVTKNVAKMWDDYAASIGTTASELTQQQKIQAEVNGILEETKFQVGDAAAYADTFSGKIAKIKTAFYNFKVAVGKFVAPIAELFLPYIELALNALTRLFNKMAQVLKVFGLEMPDVISKASNNIASVGNSASSTSDNIASTGDAAKKAAKQINKAFAGVDEINVLNMPNKASDSSSGSSGTGGAASIGGGAISDNTIVGDVTESVDSSASKIANKIKELFEPLKQIDFSNLINSFDRLKESIAPLTDKLFSGLEWLWYNILVPFAEWTIEDAIPAFFNALSGALDFLNGVLDHAIPYLEWLWDKFLQPIAKWTGGVIVEVLNGIGEALSKIGKFLSEIAPTYDEVEKKLDFSNLKNKIADFFNELPGNIGEWLGKTLGKITKFFSVDVPKAVDEFFTKTIPEKWNEFTTWLSNIDLKEIGKNIIDGLWNGIIGIGTWISEKWEEFKTSFVEGFKSAFEINSPSKVFEELGKYLVEGLWAGIANKKDWIVEKWNGVKNWFSDIKKEAKVEIKQKWADIQKSWSDLTTNIKDKTASMKAKVVTKWADIKKNWTDITSNIKNKTADMKAKVVTKWKDIKKNWTDITSNIKGKTADMKARVATTWSSLKNTWNNLMSNFKDKTIDIKAKIGAVSGSVKSMANDVISKINSKLPSWIPKIPKLAQGGWLKANNPQLAIVGDNKHEPEIVAPESKIYDQARKAVEDAGGTNTQQIEFVINVKYEDGKSIIKKINSTQIKDGKISLLV